MRYYHELAKDVPIAGTFDVIVSGGGPAGSAAAISAARNGAKTLLLETNGCLGGVWTAGLMTWVLDHNGKTGLMCEFREDMLEMNSTATIPPKAETFCLDSEDTKYMLEKKCIDAGVEIRLHTRVVAANVADRKIKFVLTESKSGREAWEAQTFIDATGDGDLAAAAGCEFDFGCPDTGLTQPMSMLCLLTGIKLDDVKSMVDSHGEWLQSKELLKAELNRAGIEPSYALPTLFHIRDDLFSYMGNHQYKVSAINANDVSRATLEARIELNRQIKGLRSLGGIWKNLRMVATGEQIGTREGRRIKGLYELTIDDLLKGAEFEDAVCKCKFNIDVHSVDPDKNKGFNSLGHKTKPYDIPLRALISKDIDNLMMAGRCISGDFLAHASYRVTGNAVPMGEAAGAYAAKKLN